MIGNSDHVWCSNALKDEWAQFFVIFISPRVGYDYVAYGTKLETGERLNHLCSM